MERSPAAIAMSEFGSWGTFGHMNRLFPIEGAALILVGIGVAAWALWGGSTDLGSATSSPESEESHPPAQVRFVLGTMWSPTAGYERTQKFIECLSKELGGHVELLQRETYAEANTLLASGGGDFGLVCAGATTDLAVRLDFDAVLRLTSEEDGGRYRAVLLVRADDPALSIDDLRGASFAWVDPSSLTGYAALRASLHASGKRADSYFGQVRFTYSHDRSVESVRSGMVRAAVVDEVVVRSMEDTAGLRVIWESEYFPTPVFLVHKERPVLTKALEALGERPECLELLGADGLEPATWDDYDRVMDVVALAR